MTIRLALLLSILVPGISYPQPTDDFAAVNRVLDDFHEAAASGDKRRYLSQMTDDAVFLGTDEQERWPRNPDFSDYVDTHFQDGRGWTYEPVDRHVRFAARADVAWFDEVVYSATNGRFRGTGVLVRDGEQWKIAHYALSFLIDNEDWDAVIELNRRTTAANRTAE